MAQAQSELVKTIGETSKAKEDKANKAGANSPKPYKVAPKGFQEWPLTDMGIVYNKALQVMFEVIDEANLWDMVKKEPGEGGFWFNDYSVITNHPRVAACGHSGATQAYALRIMQNIAKNGWENYKTSFGTEDVNPVSSVSGNIAAGGHIAQTQSEPARTANEVSQAKQEKDNKEKSAVLQQFEKFKKANASLLKPYKVGPKSIADWPAITMYTKDFRKELQVMFEVIDEANLWNMVKGDPGPRGFILDGDYSVITDHPKVFACGHSGATQAYALRIMQQIAQNGWENFKTSFATKHLDPISDAFDDTNSLENKPN